MYRTIAVINILIALTVWGKTHVFALQSTEEEKSFSEIIEKKLRHWKPPRKGYSLPPADKQVQCLEIEGTWGKDHRLDSTSLKIQKDEKGNYGVIFRTGGCLGRWTLTRKATFSNGIVTLDRPVEEYCPTTFPRMYALNLNRTTYLVPDCSVDSFLHGFGPEFEGFTRP